MHKSLRHIRKLLRVLRPRIEVGGLDITNGGAVFVSFHPETYALKKGSVAFPPGTVEGGVINDKKAFIASLQQLVRTIGFKKGKQVPVIVSISDEHVYTQTFTLPRMKRSEFREAVELNMQSVSPIDFKDVHADWEDIGEKEETGEREILASFIEKKYVDPLSEALEKAGFLVLAIEQRASSITRVLAQQEKAFHQKTSYFLVSVHIDGISFSIIRNGRVYFNRFTPWKDVIDNEKRTVSFDAFKTLIQHEINQLSNFFFSRFHKELGGIYVVSHTFQKEIVETLSQATSFPVRRPILKGGTFPDVWFSSLGCALRGLLPRSKDTKISIASEGTEEQFFHSQVISFITLWRTILITVSFILLASFFVGHLFLVSFKDTIQADVSGAFSNSQVISEYLGLKKEAERFNTAINEARVVKQQQQAWHPMIQAVFDNAGSQVLIERIHFQSPNQPVIVTARTTEEQYALEFKNKLAAIEGIKNVSLPLSAFTRNDAVTINFQMTFEVQ